jgi:hypothetical protein
MVAAEASRDDARTMLHLLHTSRALKDLEQLHPLILGKPQPRKGVCGLGSFQLKEAVADTIFLCDLK